MTPRAPPLRGAWPWHLLPHTVGRLRASGGNPPGDEAWAARAAGASEGGGLIRG